MALITPRPAEVRALRIASGRPVVETLHRAHVVVCDAAGAVLAAIGDPARETPLRSCAKPFQALALYTSGAAERFAVTDVELALACASHEGEARHLAVVEAWLARLGLGVGDLACGAHPPGDATTLNALVRADRVPTALHNNCSGKHTGMLATALALGAPPRDYVKLGHPVQRAIVKILAEVVGRPADTFAWAVDGCSAPTPVLTLAELAQLGARLVAPGTLADATLARGLELIVASMTRHADLVGGAGVVDTLLMRSVRGLVAKRGADGVQLMGLAEARAPWAHGPVGVAIKVEDGSADARNAVTLAVVEALGALVPAARTALARWVRAPRMNHRGLVVGHWDVDLGLEPAR